MYIYDKKTKGEHNSSLLMLLAKLFFVVTLEIALIFYTFSKQDGKIENSLNGVVTYELERITTDKKEDDSATDNSIPIVIDPSTGEITLAGQLDYEAQKSWKVRGRKNVVIHDFRTIITSLCGQTSVFHGSYKTFLNYQEKR